MDECSEPLMAFTTHNAVYQWKTMPFGLDGVSGIFQREVNRVLKSHLENAQAYMDDTVIFSKTFEEHLAHLKLVLAEFEKLGFSVKLYKCSCTAKKINYLGHTIVIRISLKSLYELLFDVRLPLLHSAKNVTTHPV
ncbi:retrovirus-related Pol polyprotein from transposon 297 [Trichonephila inaurata madagascariensis]|uniref:Retrovirus-related Pol polyprotein from transposon 297 n=1 Tax=Trichonephila inaurata madagascariensis TaxID=2747483 RepID=A0A8X6J6C0_9ARAC|nr:retrovirus-related Pol polyprotein from transposon 297 [Trichonephila inaurata madagascariensis]